jgi:hypothetical protein
MPLSVAQSARTSFPKHKLLIMFGFQKLMGIGLYSALGSSVGQAGRLPSLAFRASGMRRALLGKRPLSRLYTLPDFLKCAL